MSDTKKKPKRRYKQYGGVALSYDLRVRLDRETAEQLKRTAEQRGMTRAELARSILRDALLG